jgi:hypothetical protein
MRCIMAYPDADEKPAATRAVPASIAPSCREWPIRQTRNGNKRRISNQTHTDNLNDLVH